MGNEITNGQGKWEERCKTVVATICNRNERRMNQLMMPIYKESDNDEKTISLIYDINEWQLNPRGELHGGAIAAMFDLSLGIAARCASGASQVATTDMSISYLRRVEKEDRIIMHSKISKKGMLMIRITAEAMSEKTGKTVATAQGSYIIIKEK